MKIFFHFSVCLNVCVKNICVCICVVLKVQLPTFVSAVLSYHLTNVTIYPKTKFVFRRLEYNLLKFIIVIIIILHHCILLQCTFMQSLCRKKGFINPHHHHNISIRLIACLCCVAYVCVSVCCTTCHGTSK